MPEPSHLILLEQLHTAAAGTKVRFLGCVHAYDIATATVILRTRYPATARGTPMAAVCVQNVLETLERGALEVGAWVNVMGYVRGVAAAVAASQERVAWVDAAMVWTAGTVRLEKYEEATRAYLADIAMSEGGETGRGL